MPESIRKVANVRFSDYDSSLFPKEQEEVARKLLKLRVTFNENETVGKMYRADIKFWEESSAIFLKYSDTESMSRHLRSRGGIFGIDQIKHKWFQSQQDLAKVHYIDVDSWKNMDDPQKFGHLLAMTNAKNMKMMNA